MHTNPPGAKGYQPAPNKLQPPPPQEYAEPSAPPLPPSLPRVPPGYIHIPGLPIVRTAPSTAQSAPSTQASIPLEIQTILHQMEITGKNKGLMRSLYTELGPNSWKCQVCGHTLKSRESINRHIRESHLQPKFICDICGTKFMRKDHLTDHLKNPGKYHNGLKKR